MLKINSLKTTIAGILMVPALALLSVVAVPSVAYAQEATPAPVTTIDGGIKGGAGDARSEDQVDELFGSNGIFKTITNIALYLIGALSVLMLIYGGIRYTISAGDAKQVESAKNTIMYAIIGIVVALLAFAIVNFVLDSLVGK